MKHRNEKRHGGAALCAAALCLTAALALSAAGASFALQTPQNNTSPASTVTPTTPASAAFEERVKEYAKLREGIEGKMPKLSKEAKPEEIEAHKAAFQKAVREARAGALPGELFRPDVAAHIRAVIKNEFRGRDRAQLRQTVFEAETKGVPLRVNYPYPESKELVEMPPTLLLKLPQLPKQVRYRFVGSNLLLVDRENGLIIDYMTNALP